VLFLKTRARGNPVEKPSKFGLNPIYRAGTFSLDKSDEPATVNSFKNETVANDKLTEPYMINLISLWKRVLFVLWFPDVLVDGNLIIYCVSSKRC
jgi:hypothetical protein